VKLVEATFKDVFHRQHIGHVWAALLSQCSLNLQAVFGHFTRSFTVVSQHAQQLGDRCRQMNIIVMLRKSVRKTGSNNDRTDSDESEVASQSNTSLAPVP
jgi:hypothetical protein